MAVTAGSLQALLAGGIESDTGATHQFSKFFSNSLQDSDDNFLYDRAWVMEDYVLTVVAGDLDVDLYDLGSIDLGAGAGRDNLGLTHANARILALGIRNQEISGGGTLRIDQVGAGSTAWSGLGHADIQLDMKQGAYLHYYFGETGTTVTDTTDHILRLNAQTSDVTIDVVFFSKQT